MPKGVRVQILRGLPDSRAILPGDDDEEDDDVDECKVGDIVLLNSGSPRLTVVERFTRESDNQAMVRVKWIVGMGGEESVKTDTFPVACLKAAPVS